MIIDKYYVGFEGEPEIQFIREGANGERIILSIWEGYFDSIISAIKPDQTGWTGLAYYYQLHQGWYENSPWRLPDINDAMEQLSKIDAMTLDDISQKVLCDVEELLFDAKRLNETVYIAYF